MQTLRRIRLLLEDFPKNYNLILVGQPEQMEGFITTQLDRCGLGHNTFTEEAVRLIIRSADGILRRTRNLCLGSLIEAVRIQKKTIDIDLINRVLIQPHWMSKNDYKDIS